MAIVRWRENNDLDKLLADPAWCDPVMAGWWIWGQSCWIGRGWCSGTGPWHVDHEGRVVRQERSSGTREPGVSRRLPHLTNNGRGANHQCTREPGVPDDIDGDRIFHPMTMPDLLRWFEFLSSRLRHVRIIQGDWQRALTPSASKTLSVRMGNGICGVFLDPPYSTEAERTMSIYTNDCGEVAHDVRAWCLANGDDPQYRIVLAGYDSEHVELEAAGWRVVEWFKTGFLKGGMGNTGKAKFDEDGNKIAGGQQKRERLWLSPHCICATKI
jgi:hypothetical protein